METNRRRNFLPYLIATGACALVIWFFAPRLEVWSAWWKVPDFSFFYGPEIGRARNALWQVEHLGEPIPDPNHTIIRWRLLFPGMAKVLALPNWIHLALYPLGVFATAVFLGWHLRQRGSTTPTIVCASVAFLANAWFFTSTGWLAYADAWVVFGLLVITLSPRLWPALLAGMAFPWCDDRFVLALPVALVCRILLSTEDRAPDWRAIRRTYPFLLIGPAAFILARLWLEFGTGTSTVARLGFPKIAENIRILVWGVWEGWRAAWVFPAFGVFSTFSESRWKGLLLAGISVAAFSSALFTAHDFSRAGLMLAPLVAVAILRLSQEQRGFRIMAFVAIANIMLPASHIISDIQIPIFPLRYELYRNENPLPPFTPALYAESAVQQAQAGDQEQAKALFQVAAKLAPNAASTLRAEALLAFHAGDTFKALDILAKHSETHPNDHETRLLEVKLLAGAGFSHQANQKAVSLLKFAPPGSPAWKYLKTLTEAPQTKP